MTVDSPAIGKTALHNVRVFDGHGLTEPTTVVIDGAVIGTDAGGAEGIDGHGAILLPGLIDAHVHLSGIESLDRLAAHGVTTALDMTTWPPERLAALRDRPGTTDIRSAGTPIIGEGGLHAQIPGMAEHAVIHGPDEAEAMVAERAAAGSDYIKLMLEAPGEGGPDEASAKAVVAAAHAQELRIVAHAASLGAYTLALDVGADIVTHVPADGQLPAEDVRRMAAEHRVAAPTLVMMQGIAKALGMLGFADCLASVATLHAAGVPVLAGSDANSEPGVPYQPPHGDSLHRELELLVTAGLSAAAALRAATTLPAQHFGLPDRGAIAPGMRADLVLLEGDPLADIHATRAITRVWCGGIAHV
ncbi:imidazolonepropionase-like amidohydrolase [Nocardia tenerifensis]|uniref:Imidazolonepropionase-like amidohydrolase n=1 Tax=Nocardia tenerifensis TaxID=228006 RepID=A0A318JUV9_9NOCA|nr:amidohydrolase family protein [Nocardia tenerifensis]PXX60884.1 imidazolonepropionase-like amidohydrolase [Nocardia tenerifensis]